MAERGSCGTTNDRGASEDGGPVTGSSGVRRVVPLRPAVRRSSESVPVWADPGWAEPVVATGAWSPDESPCDDEPRVPWGSAWPFEPDPEAAAFLNAPRRPLEFYVAPFGTPPFGNPPSGGPRPTLAGPSGTGRSARVRSSDPAWGPAYPAGA